MLAGSAGAQLQRWAHVVCLYMSATDLSYLCSIYQHDGVSPDATQLILCDHVCLFTVNGPHPHIQHILILGRGQKSKTLAIR